MENITQEQAINAYRNAPEAIRAVFNSEETAGIVPHLQKRLGLHIDSAGILAKEIGYLLLGITDPNKFIVRLKNNNFSDQTIDAIVTEINQKIFIPLREKMKSGGTTVPEVAKPAAPQTTATRQPPAALASTYAPPLQSPRYTRPVDESVSDHPAQPLNIQRAAPPSLSATKSAVRAAMSAPSKPLPNEKLLEDHEEPHIEFDKTPPPVQRHVVSAPLPPPNLPGAMPPVAPPPSPRPIPSAKPYASDPYREPIDEKE